MSIQPSDLSSTDAKRLGSKASEKSTTVPLGTLGHRDNGTLIEELYEQWRTNPESVDVTWRSFFEGFSLGCQHAPSPSSPRKSTAAPAGETPDYWLKQGKIHDLLFAYRTLGHRISNLDPLGFNKSTLPDLDLHNFKFTEADLDTTFDSMTLAGGGRRTLRDILRILKESYCGNLATEYMHIQDFGMRRWVRDRVESTRDDLTVSKKERILHRLIDAEQLERFLHTRFVGQKRFSLEGGETLIPMLDAILENCQKFGVSQLVMGMAHRGRINVMANILGKDFKQVFAEFAGLTIPTNVGDGDVKYHLGYDSSVVTSSGSQVGVTLAPNPSHLETVNPIVEGKARAWQRLLNDTETRSRVIPILMHGDAAFIGQGVVAETFNMSQLEGYATGGTIHIIINNQIGFTTIPKDSRSATYCTALAKSFDLPIFHVNGDDPVSAIRAIELALEFRQTFKKDVIIDLYCYRRHGHNEGDEPNFTQPTLYQNVDKHPLVSDVLMKEMIQKNQISEEKVTEYKKSFENRLTIALNHSKEENKDFKPFIRPPLQSPEILQSFDSAVPAETIRKIGFAISAQPANFNVNPKLIKWLDQRRQMAEGKSPLDWSMAEALSFGSLLVQKIPIRLSGQDCRRGTFSQRHSVLYDATNRNRYIPLMHIQADQERYCVYNSPLSEYAVLGFDYGYSLNYSEILIMWEAQFGDFINGAQIVIDQYITSAETKWGTKSNIVLLLPHGYHGQGPEHSSSRFERFLQACAEDNIIVTNCSTPAQYFHILRRQALRKTKKPLIIMTPKGLLRDKRCVSNIDELSTGRFEEILPDPTVTKNAKRVIFCTGKVFFDLQDYQKTNNVTDTAIIRIEQMYPLHTEKLKSIVAQHAKADQFIWCQEEPVNMGAWSFMEPRLRALFKKEIQYIGRDESSSPATGYHGVHELEQADLVQKAFQKA
ncbi:MAG: 2-oxoglutarate dehydrogenase E1 component [Verrucomicrobiota bacterium]